MTPPALNSNDRVAQALQAEREALNRYNAAGYEVIRLQTRAESGDEAARSKLQDAETNRIQAQKDLKEAQSRLAKLTGGMDPHRPQRIARRAHEPQPRQTKKAVVARKAQVAGKDRTSEEAPKPQSFMRALQDTKIEILKDIIDKKIDPKKYQDLIRILDKPNGEEMHLFGLGRRALEQLSVHPRTHKK